MAEWISTHNGVTMICFLSMVFLLLICALSPPTSNRLSFLSTTITRVISGTETEMQTIKVSFGVFGYTGSKASVGYYMPPYFPILDFSENEHKKQTYHILTYFLFLYPITATFFGLAFIIGLFPTRSRTTKFRLMSCVFIILGSVCSLGAWVCSSALFIYIGDSLASSEINSDVGVATWLAIAVLSVTPGSIALCHMYERFTSGGATLPASTEPRWASVPENDVVVDIVDHRDAMVSEVELGVYSGGLVSASAEPARPDSITIPGRDSFYYDEHVADLIERMYPR